MSAYIYNPQSGMGSTVAIPNTTKQITVSSTAQLLSAFAEIDQSTVNASELFFIQVGSADDIKLTYDGTDPSTVNAITIPSSTTVFSIQGNENIKNIKIVRAGAIDVTCIVWFERMV
jgi:hypothetical protein